MASSNLLGLLEAGELELTASSADRLPPELAAVVGAPCCDALRRLPLQTLVYVACCERTLADDCVHLLGAGGFYVVGAERYDHFAGCAGERGGGVRGGGGSSLQPALAAFAPWRGCSMRTQSYASQLAAAEAGTSRDGRRSTGDRRRARGSRFFLQKTPARRRVRRAGRGARGGLVLYQCLYAIDATHASHAQGTKGPRRADRADHRSVAVRERGGERRARRSKGGGFRAVGRRRGLRLCL